MKTRLKNIFLFLVYVIIFPVTCVFYIITRLLNLIYRLMPKSFLPEQERRKILEYKKQKKLRYKIEITDRGENFTYTQEDKRINGMVLWYNKLHFYLDTVSWSKPTSGTTIPEEEKWLIFTRVFEFITIDCDEVVLVTENAQYWLRKLLLNNYKEPWKFWRFERFANEITCKRKVL